MNSTKKDKKQADGWLDNLKSLVQKKPLVVFQFDDEEWSRLRESRRGANEFTIARSHDLFEKVRVPTACLVIGRGDDSGEIYFGLASSRSAVTTLESRIKVKRASHIKPSSKSDIIKLVTDKAHGRNLRKRLATRESVIALSPKLSVHLLEQLAAIESNHGAMRAAVASLFAPKYYRGMDAMQEDAVHTALRAFGLSPDDQANSVELVRGQDTALARVNIMEDSVVEHDARTFPDYELTGSDITGQAIFERGHERLEIFTANRRPLEKVFGVDLIYVNTTRQNIVTVQYKMLEPDRRKDDETDWIYRPDANLDSEIERMRKFSQEHPAGAYEYRLNPQVFYLKFVKRDGALGNAGIVLPIDHFERLRADPSCKGPRGAIRVSFESLAGRYLRQGPFLDLIRAGYLGATAKTTAYLKDLVDAVVKGDRAVVGAIQSYREEGERFSRIADDLSDYDPSDDEF
ncbi:hypothetical protein [Microbulbifer halophilus]|uniref:PH domain-containing protein n=1 Tax=Microbulbifer halophilus TaxID=453963 RepID=A0ABW5ECX8_9GAMM|nr:hypothetical protein [Microbulbifer halophilus]MCW8128088.1 hypothetical protein [Microbulbifer halophilus]